jgi:hypothetical protein
VWRILESQLAFVLVDGEHLEDVQGVEEHLLLLHVLIDTPLLVELGDVDKPLLILTEFPIMEILFHLNDEQICIVFIKYLLVLLLDVTRNDLVG